jgi:formylglycine-generating enzyme required for sulfatase activity
MKILRFSKLAATIMGASVWVFATPVRAQSDVVPESSVPENMVLVPAGAFTMGSVDRDYLMGGDAAPSHSVTLPAYFIDKTEVTNAEYKKYCDATGYPAPHSWVNGVIAAGQENFPVTHISWYEAGAFAAWKGKRLPTEAEWEKAARGTDARTFPWGNTWVVANTTSGQNAPSAVGSKPQGASPFGALDMAGNVFEWTNDWYQRYAGSTMTSPAFGTKYKVVRGGGFDGSEGVYKTHYRSLMRPNAPNSWIGFRCVQPAPNTPVTTTPSAP